MQSSSKILSHLSHMVYKNTSCFTSTYKSSLLPRFNFSAKLVQSNQNGLKCNTFIRHMAGHSKWQNIKHIKALKDSQKSKIFVRHTDAIRRACLDGGVNPKTNAKLAMAVEAARGANMPSSTIDNVLKRAENKKLVNAMLEIEGPSGCFLILDIECESIQRLTGDIKLACRRSKICGIAKEGRTRMVFDRKGVIRTLATKDGIEINSETALDDAILAGAEDVQSIVGEDEITILQFTCNPNDFHGVKKHIENSKYIIQDAAVEYLPVQKASLTEEEMIEVSKFLSVLEEKPDILKIYDNIE